MVVGDSACVGQNGRLGDLKVNSTLFVESNRTMGTLQITVLVQLSLLR